jgi:hydrogenase-4 component F
LATLFFVLGIPLLGSVVLALTGHRDSAREINVAFSLGTFVATCVLTVEVISGGPLFAWNREFYIDPLNVFLVTLTAFVGLTTAIFSRPYMRVERDHGKMTPNRMRLYHSMYQLFSFTMLIALTTNNLGILWVAMEAATLTTVLLVSVYRTPASLEAAWKYFILCGVGIAQALFGTVLLYMAAEKVIGTEGGALLWTNLDAVKAQLDPAIITLAFAFLFIGYGTKVGLVPMHNWLPDAHAEGTDAGFGGALGPAAQRRGVCPAALQGAHRRRAAQPPRRSVDDRLRPAVGGRGGLLPVAAEGRQAHVRLFVDRTHGADHLRLRHGRPIANYAGLLHMTVHSLIKSGIFFAVGHATQKAGTQNMADIRGLIKVSPTVGWG